MPPIHSASTAKPSMAALFLVRRAQASPDSPGADAPAFDRTHCGWTIPDQSDRARYRPQLNARPAGAMLPVDGEQAKIGDDHVKRSC
jgi:hypothetical protein